MKNRFFPVGLFALALSVVGYADDGSGLKISGAADIVGQVGLSQASPTQNRIDPRETEIVLYSPVDWLFDGQFSAAAHQENGQLRFEVHEAFLGSTKLIPRSRFRLGQFFLGVGRLNQTHRHDWPFTSAPKVQREFFADEAASDTGLEYSFLAPLPIYMDLTVGITNGWVFGHADNLGVKALFPTHYGRLAFYAPLPLDGGAQMAVNYLARTDSEGRNTKMVGLDAAFKWRDAETVKFLFQTEIWGRRITPRDGAYEDTVGMYFFPNYHVGNGFFTGLRTDFFFAPNLKDSFGDAVSNLDWAVAPMIAYKASEFSTLRLSYTHSESKTSTPGYADNVLELQAVFILGAHPAHDF